MAYVPQRQPDQRAKWFEDQIRREQEKQKAEREARRADDFEARQALRSEPGNDEGFLQALAAQVSDHAHGRAAQEGGPVARDIANPVNFSTYQEPAELDAMFTPHPTHRSPPTEIGPGAASEADGLRSTIQTLNSQLDMETRRHEQLEQALEHAKRQVAQYAADKRTAIEQQGAAVMDDNHDEVARLKLRAEEMRKLWVRSTEDVARLEEELIRKDEMITALRRQINSQAQDAPRYDAPRYDAPLYDAQRHDAQRHDAQRHDAQRHDAQRHDAQRHDAQHDASNESGGGGQPTQETGRSKRTSSTRYLSRRRTGIELINGEAVHRLTGAQALVLC